MLTTIAQRLESFINFKNLSQKEFCKIIGYPESSLSGFLNGKTSSPRIELIEGIVNHFPELDIVWLFSGSGQMLRDASEKNGGPAEEKLGSVTRTEIIELLKKRVNELEREIARKDPDLAKALGIE